jgi:hypothetical protein
MKRLSLVCISAVLCLSLLFPLRPFASDYKPWIPLLPSELGGLKKKDKPQGMNMEIDGEKWSSLTQSYGDEGSDKEATLTIVCGNNAPQMQQFKAVPKMKMETEEQLMTTVKVEGRDTFLTLDKEEKSGFVMILVDERLLVTLEMQDCTDQEKLLSAAERIPFGKFKCEGK